MKSTEGLRVLLAALVAVFALEVAAAEPDLRGREEREQRLHEAWPLGMASGGVSRVLLIREGAVVPMRELMAVEGLNRELRFEVGSGRVRFGDGSNVAARRAGANGVVSTPALRAGPAHDESSIEITTQGRSLGVLRVQTIPSGNWESVLDVLSGDPDVVLERAPDYAVVNTAMMKTSGRAIQQRLASGPGGIEAADPDGAGMRAMAVSCGFRQPWGPGWVNWSIADPAQWGYSVKPENTWSLVWARAPGQDADGIYNRYWNCYSALKVPDNCTATVEAGMITCCCNETMATYFGKVCEWLNPAHPDINWPECPL